MAQCRYMYLEIVLIYQTIRLCVSSHHMSHEKYSFMGHIYVTSIREDVSYLKKQDRIYSEVILHSQY